MTNGDFPMKHGGSYHSNRDFPMNNGDFPMVLSPFTRVCFPLAPTQPPGMPNWILSIEPGEKLLKSWEMFFLDVEMTDKTSQMKLDDEPSTSSTRFTRSSHHEK